LEGLISPSSYYFKIIISDCFLFPYCINAHVGAVTIQQLSDINQAEDVHARALNYQCMTTEQDQVISVPTVIDCTMVPHALGVLSSLLALPKGLSKVPCVSYLYHKAKTLCPAILACLRVLFPQIGRY
jgi:hypothetical protein